MAETWNKKEREKKKQAIRKEKAEKKQERKEQNKEGGSLESKFAYDVLYSVMCHVYALSKG